LSGDVESDRENLPSHSRSDLVEPTGIAVERSETFRARSARTTGDLLPANSKGIEAQSGARFFFATPHHSWERGTSENTNGLIRQYLPTRTSMASVSQHRCDIIAEPLNTRPRKRLDYLTPEEACDLYRD
jgi:hypothetical protein